MDSLTHIVVGAALGEALFGKKIGNKAMLWGAMAASFPDLDVVSVFFLDAVKANEFHRGITHSFLFIILLAPLLGWLGHRVHKRQAVSRKEWSWFMLTLLLSHPLLDMQTTYGTQLFWPLENRITCNNLFVIDPLYTLPLLMFFILAMLKKRNHPKRERYLKIGFIVSCSYILLTLGFKGIAHYQFVKNLKQQNITYTNLEAKPTLFNSILWCGFVETNDSFLLGYYSIFDGTTPLSFISFPKKHALLGEMKNEDAVKRMIKLSGGWYNIEKTNDLTLFYDLRFGQKGISNDANSFVFCYNLSYKDNVLIARSAKPNFKGFKEGLGQLFLRLKGK